MKLKPKLINVRYQNPSFLPIYKGQLLPKDIQDNIYFKNISRLLEFYFHALIQHPQSINFERLEEALSLSSFTSNSPLLDCYATIGLYLNELGSLDKRILALFYGRSLGDNQIAKVFKFETPDSIKYKRLKCIRKMDKKFRKIGLLRNE